MNFRTIIKYVLSSFLLIIALQSRAQLTTSTVMTPAQLVQNVLLGPGITATNITYTGSALARGTFNGAASNLGISSGVLLATGKILNAIGPNNNSGNTTVFNLAGDPDLNIITSPSSSHDAAVLEFDFIPRTDTVKFRYIFGSEEYMEYVNSPPLPATVNDGFGFFISGPGISGPFSNSSVNIAVIPGTTLPVTMYNLSLNNHSAYYFDNGNGQGTGTAPDGATVQYDGFTVPLTATSYVQCGQTYHIKIAIGDGYDWSNDSGVFLEEGSFSSSENIPITSNMYVAGQLLSTDTVLYEGCGDGRIHFKRIGTPCSLILPDTVYFTVSGTASNGVDYSTIGDSVFFAPNVDTTSIHISSIPDALIEGNETITLTMNNSTPPSSITITIIDSPPLTVSLNPDITYNCPPSSLLLTAVVAGGTTALPYQYNWTNASSANNVATVYPLQTTAYYVTVTDVCGVTASDSTHAIVTAYTPMQMTVSRDTNICKGDAVTLKTSVTGGKPPYTYSWGPSASSFDSVVVSPAISTTYTITVTDQCSQTISQQINVTTHMVQASFTAIYVTNQNVQFNNVSSGANNSFWSFGDNSNDSVSTMESPVHYFPHEGSFTVKLVITNLQGCKDSMYQTIVVLPDFYFYFPNSFTPNNDGRNDIFVASGLGLKTYAMSIYNRFGELLFFSEDMTKGWDGTYMGRDAEIGQYICVFDIETINKKEFKKIGTITLIR